MIANKYMTTTLAWYHSNVSGVKNCELGRSFFPRLVCYRGKKSRGTNLSMYDHCFSSHPSSGAREKNDHSLDDQGFTLTHGQKRALRLLQEQPEINDTNSMLEVNISPPSHLKSLKEMSLQSDLEQYEEKPSPWFNLLMHPSRALWRSSPHPPPKYILDTQFDILQRSERGSKQLKRTYELILTRQKGLVERRERERRGLINHSNQDNGINDENDYHIGSMKKKKYPMIGKSDSQPIYYKPEYTLSSLKFRLVPNYSITKRVLAETHSLLGIKNFQPKRIIDVGCGVGSASAAALDYFRHGRGFDRGYQIQWIHAIDPSQSMRDAASFILNGIVKNESFTGPVDGDKSMTRITLGDSLTSSSGPPSQLAFNEKGQGSFDLALCAYTLSEIPSVASVLSIAAIIWEKLALNGVAIFIEPGTPDGFNALRSVRSMLLDCCPPNQSQGRHEVRSSDSDIEPSSLRLEECHVIAPCTHNGTCPMERHKKKKNSSSQDNDTFSYRDVDDSETDIPDDYSFSSLAEDKIGRSYHPDLIDDENDLDDDDFISDSCGAWNDQASISETDGFSSAFCSFVHRIPGGKTSTIGEKFCYLVVQKRTEKSVQLFDMDQRGQLYDKNLVDLLTQSFDAAQILDSQSRREKRKRYDEGKYRQILKEAIALEDLFVQSNEDKLGLELVQGDNRRSFGRIIRAPIKKRGHVIIDFCSLAEGNMESCRTNLSRGHIVRQKISRNKSVRVAPGMYGAARKARWGGLWPDVRKKES